jgi:hypothetical protein
MEGETATDGPHWRYYYDGFDHLVHTGITVWRTNSLMEEQSSHRITGWFRPPCRSFYTLGDLSERTCDDCSTTGMFLTLPHHESLLSS